MQKFIRFGDIPKDECSIECIGNGDAQRPARKLNGVSVYDCFLANGAPQIVIPPINAATLDTLYGLIQYSNRPIYLVTGDIVGIGSDNEPLIKNVKIIERIEINHS